MSKQNGVIQPPTSCEDVLRFCGTKNEHFEQISQLCSRVEVAFPNDCREKARCLEAIDTLRWSLMFAEFNNYETMGYEDFTNGTPPRTLLHCNENEESYNNGFLIAYALSGQLNKASVDYAERILTRKQSAYEIQTVSHLVRVTNELAGCNDFAIKPFEQWPELSPEFDVSQLEFQASKLNGEQIATFVDGETNQVNELTTGLEIYELHKFLIEVFQGELHEHISCDRHN
ncbi:hypothetical protein VIBNISOn1_1050016 [Vibrio nigripulchritudo SOn1]|uniref:Uncharacterized protein n=1 Tax=Vibrio nigripulchritudo SOn1 TaxID=1238450 RepID=A0AAV2VHS0_9VIBR|nr:hypothetical protein [Vibrio nigripulchritudo]CCO44190.1 hypothetical protein VIBNISOn1_1050016 [Vibrio nigripulchritudo SOn1]